MSVRHILGISSGKDSAALAIYLPQEQSEVQSQKVPVRVRKW